MMIKRYFNSEAFISAGLILLASVITYAVLIPSLGFYRDDWYMIWTAQAEGPQGVLNLFKSDRPFIGYLYVFDYSLLGKSTLHWHIYALVIKLIGGFALLWLLRMIWPQRKVETTFTTLLFMIYPGFYQQANAATFKNLLLALTAVNLSLALTIFSTKARSPVLRILSILTAAMLSVFYLAIYEALIGLEAARIILLWYVLRRNKPEMGQEPILLTTTKWSLPYLAVAMGFAYWRIFLFDSTRRSTSVDLILGEYTLAPGHSFIVLFSEYLKDLIETTVFAWSVPFYNLSQSIGRYRDFGNAILLAAIVVGLCAGYLILAKRLGWSDSEASVTNSVTRDFIGLGALIVMVTTIPIIAAGRNVVFGLQWDRYTAQSILGAALFVCGFTFYAVRSPVRWAFLFGLIAISVATQFMSSVFYRDFWSVERNMWWQLSWRVPGFESGTTVIGAAPRGYRFAEEYEVWGPLNMIYHPHSALMTSGQIMYDGIEVDMAAAKLEERNNRNILISRDYGKAVIVSMPTPTSCVHVINGQMLELPSFEDPAVAAAAPYSRSELVLTSAEPSTPPVEVFGSEPVHNWCYFYEKMDLARQKLDWQEVIRLGELAQSQDLAPHDTSEWMPLYTAFVNSGELEQAKQLVKRMKADRDMVDRLCLQIEATRWPASYNEISMDKILCGKGN